jgi:predicted TPR repeat methyltransferase
MTNTPKYFPRAYGIKSQSDINALYDDWAQSYDEEVKENGYVSPMRTAQALQQFAPSNAKILDFGCGTGLSGKALRSCDFTNLTGSELNVNMLDIAEQSNIYQNLIHTTLEIPFPAPKGTYDVITAVGVISSGAGPASLLHLALEQLNLGGLIAFSYNDAALNDPSYTEAVADAIASGKAEKLFEEYGDHLSKKDVGSMIYVLKRT